MKEERKTGARLVGVLLTAAAVLWLLLAVENLQHSRNDYEQTQLEEALRRGAVACYAAEGIYPPDLDYLRQHYGLQVDERHFDVFYEVFASNIMPDITVVEKEP